MYDSTKGSLELVYSEYNATWTATSNLFPNVTWILMSGGETLLHEDAKVTDDCLISSIAVGNQDIEWSYGIFYLNQKINEIDSYYSDQATANLNDNNGYTYVIDYDKQVCYYLKFDLYRGTYLKFLTISRI